MKTVINKTNAPIKVPLPRNKSLHLGPLKSGQVRDEDADRPGVAKMVEAGTIEISDADAGANSPGGRGDGRSNAGRSGGGAGVSRRGGDR